MGVLSALPKGLILIKKKSGFQEECYMQSILDFRQMRGWKWRFLEIYFRKK